MRATANIVELRRLLAEHHPAARCLQRPPLERPVAPSGVPALDTLLHGGWPKGQLSELIGDGPGSGSTQIIHALLQQLAATGQFLALIDGRDSFDVDAVEPDVLARLLWVRCRQADEALKAADILLRDRNFPFVLIDLKLNPAAQLRKIPSSVWHRFRRLQEQNGTTVLVVTPTQLIGGAHCRVRVASQLNLSALTQPPTLETFELLRAPDEDAAQKAG